MEKLLKTLNGNHKLGAVLSIVGILASLLILFLLASIYQVNIDGKIASKRPDEAITVQIVFAMLSWIGVSAGALWVTVLYGFMNKADWAWGMGAVAATVQLLSSFFPMIPSASIGAHPYYLGLPDCPRALVWDAPHWRRG